MTFERVSWTKKNCVTVRGRVRLAFACEDDGQDFAGWLGGGKVGGMCGCVNEGKASVGRRDVNRRSECWRVSEQHTHKTLKRRLTHR